MLIDNFGRTIDYVRVSVTDRCDLRCSYCIPKGFKGFEEPKNWLTFDEIERVVAAFARLGTHHFRLTGGEPLLRRNLPQLVQRLSDLPNVQDLSLTTNATQLARHAKALREAGLNRLNVSLDSLRKECVEQITGSDNLEQVLKGLSSAKEAGFNKIKINMVPLAGVNQSDIEQMVQFCIEHDFVLRLIEVMPMGVTGQSNQYVNLQGIIDDLQQKFALIESDVVLGNGPARYWQTDNGGFSLGLITPMSQHFCATCNRVRLSVDGTLYMCLGQDNSFSLRPLLRDQCSDQELEEAIRYAMTLKPEAHNFLEQPKKIMRIMSMTGG
ncbi:GTP 3',8-cyclase MoaA [Neisseria sp. Ec49-e6-T10]|uniref:GTP 3',8-cyclase MoaA n=1 Tax=Neisseria sp. Ec49-e6-T10 TaxID=3140744 RepID=UPI003EBF9C34